MAATTETWTTPDGDADRHLSLSDLEDRLRAMPPAPKDRGLVVAIFARPGSNERAQLERARLTASSGVPGDRWSAPRPDGRTAKPGQQLATMQSGVAELIANGQPIGLFGDNLFLDLDLSKENLPVGTRVRVGQALLEVTPEPHDGCVKFKGRFGADALRLVARKETRDRNLRGIYFKVVEDGDVAAGDAVEVLRGS
jgi:MOSC domain-containing protein YiiM